MIIRPMATRKKSSTIGGMLFSAVKGVSIISVCFFLIYMIMLRWSQKDDKEVCGTLGFSSQTEISIPIKGYCLVGNARIPVSEFVTAYLLKLKEEKEVKEIKK